jgi:hypothetical protein
MRHSLETSSVTSSEGRAAARRSATWALWLTVLVLAVLAGSLYATRLQYAPVYLASDEIKFALQARSIAATGRDLNGQLLPL